jgi:predicted dehydrogenase
LTRLAVIGTKGIGRTHVETIASLDGCELAAVCDVNAKEARSCGEAHGCPHYSDLDRMLSEEKPDGICVCTPHWHHPPIALKAFETGVHVLTEKPLAVTVEDAERMIDAARAAGCILGVVFQHRMDPVNVKAREIVSSGQIGEIHRTMLAAAWFRPEAYYRSDAWRGTWKGEGGGVLLNQAPHTIDLFLWISGMVPETLCATTETVLHSIKVEDRASALLRYPNGATGYIHASTAEFPTLHRMEFAGDRGRLVLDDGIDLTVADGSIREFSKSAPEPSSTPTATPVDVKVAEKSKGKAGELKPVGGHDLMIADFAEAIREGSAPAVPGEEALKSLEIANAITLSSHRRAEVDLPIPRRAYSELVGLLAGRAGKRRKRRSTTKKRRRR